MHRTKSLRMRLFWSFTLLQAVSCIVVLAAVFAILLATDKLEDESAEQSAELIAQSLSRDAEGKLQFDPSAQSRLLKVRAADLWFVVRDAQGQVLRHGDVPQRYAAAMDHLGDIQRVYFDPADRGRPQGRYERMQSPVGEVSLLLQTGARLSFLGNIWAAFIVFAFMIAPMATVAILGMVVVTPLLVRYCLRELNDIAVNAQSINVRERHTRLPAENAVKEVRPLVDAVNQALDRLAEGYERQERFLRDAAHELRTPIATLQIQIEGLSNTSEKPGALRSISRLALLADQLLDLQRLDRGERAYVPLDLTALCERVVADIAPLVLLNDCTIELHASSRVPSRGDEGAIERAVTNLIGNAIQHGGRGTHIDVTVEADGVIEVSDTGIGIPEAERSRVVDAFYRISNSAGGAGIGLFLVSEVARLHGGYLRIGASDSGGACMRLELWRREQ